MNDKDPIINRRKYFDEAELRLLNETGNESLQKLARVLKESLPLLEAELSKYGLQENGTANLCVIATSSLDKILKSADFNSVILEGEVELEPHHHLSHRVNVVETSQKWVVIDLTANQLPDHKK